VTCAKKVVRCVIISPSGRAYEGENWCDEPQEVCPREPGEGYEKCKSICHQTNHAEINALFAAGTDANGATAFLHGHHHYCKACQLALFSAGIKSLAVPIE
jgi:deoxycytidylate deaminase